jgi:hypothetical protein
MTQPFQYPSDPHVRRHGPRGYANYASFRPWLRDEFQFRCVYCLAREQWGRVGGHFALDHFLPVANHPAQVTDYDNLIYACSTCNATKGDRAIPDALSVLLRSAVRIAKDGTIDADNPEAARPIEILGLDSLQTTEFRMRWIGIVSLAALHDPELHKRLMGYPEELPDLRRLRPPGGNSRPEGLAQSALVRRERGELPEVY